MIKRSSSRNQRSKSIKVKHVLQIILLVGICFWLIYQVKRSHDKKKEFDESDAKVSSVGTQTAHPIPKLGRKDLQPVKDKVNQDERRKEEEEDEIIVEDEDKLEHKEGKVRETGDKEDEKDGARGGGEEQEDDENRSGEVEDERGVGDDEIDENDQEKSEVDADHDEFIDEEKEKAEEGDEKENENSKDEETAGLVESHNSHEAREEHYKADDASSAVTHDTHTTSTETDKVSLESSGINSEIGITKSENRPYYYTEDIITIGNEPSSYFNITEVKLTSETYSNATSGNETRNISLSNSVDSSHLNSTALTYSNSHSETTSNLTLVFHGANNNMTKKTVTFSNQAQNDSANSAVTRDEKNVQTEGLEQGGNGVSKENLPGSNITITVKTENKAAARAGGESSNLEGGDIETTRRFVGSNESENKLNTEMSKTIKTRNNNSSYARDNTNAIKDGESKGDTQRSKSKTSDSSSANGTSDSYDSQSLKSVTEIQTDMDTLPDRDGEGTAMQ